MKKYKEIHSIVIATANAKMRLNAHKGQIEDVEPDRLFEMLQGEIDELRAAMEKGDIMHVIEEAGDVFNFLTGVVHQQVTLYRMRK